METCHEMNCPLSGGAQEVTNVQTLTASVRQDTERRLNSGIVVYRSRISSGHFGQVLTQLRPGFNWGFAIYARAMECGRMQIGDQAARSQNQHEGYHQIHECREHYCYRQWKGES